MPGTSPLWLEISLDRVGDEVRVSARGSQGQRTDVRPLGGGFDVPALRGYAASVREAARRGEALSPELLGQGRALHRALLEGEVGELHSELRGRLDQAAAGRLVVRLVVHDDELKAVPWEAACKPGEALGFWGSAPDLLPVRGVVSLEPWLSREVRGAVRVLAVAPAGGAALATLHDALTDRIDAGEIEWLEPVGGARAQVKYLFDRLRREPLPHVLHFLGHGGIDSKGRPVLRLADDDDDEERWLPVESLAQHLEAHLRGVLRLVVLEACEGARPSAFASAAEILARKGADAVLAHLWPVKAEMARSCSRELYGALAGAHPGSGDVALALNEARRVMLALSDTRAEAFSPVLYLRAPDGKLFDFKDRRVARPPIVAPAPAAAGALDPDFVRLLGKPFSLVLGDRLKDERAALTGFRQKLHEGLAENADPAPQGLSMGALAQRFEFRRSPDDLEGVFQETFG
nr:CHAT domain-containing protein [Polyangiaceae bacterium]